MLSKKLQPHFNKKIYIYIEFLKGVLVGGFLVSTIFLLQDFTCLTTGSCIEEASIGEDQQCETDNFGRFGEKIRDCSTGYDTWIISRGEYIANNIKFGFAVGSLGLGIILGGILAERKRRKMFYE
ncbi:MAG: hypothetical protein UT12_C0019G0005 [Candidatus Curtissbacteria bacterium GW2011_GWC2_38_9]|uniref:Uncharacterized protein n=3 Tax=Candidatus Curtissiibacteriota TaxID=1752717 RepID=A0A1F5HSU5_9BACT|nr:MAG: hypothetical protein UT12_C0019G0005 [Candidatus Curtissbacteria bacterium GW2011_GWC2_38_9]KKS03256.1 MAG: hypothetical protein UU56_C0021G0004 [Candidatus Curtissbacteria bacterium GW2011_GWA2_41_24]OGE07224.1 MAG: hypothetical protein A2W70_02200 [Candidatus Curtissbacteria bacterium RIFCSPLOWO2_02_41_11]